MAKKIKIHKKQETKAGDDVETTLQLYAYFQVKSSLATKGFNYLHC